MKLIIRLFSLFLLFWTAYNVFKLKNRTLRLRWTGSEYKVSKPGDMSGTYLRID